MLLSETSMEMVGLFTFFYVHNSYSVLFTSLNVFYGSRVYKCFVAVRHLAFIFLVS